MKRKIMKSIAFVMALVIASSGINLATFATEESGQQSAYETANPETVSGDEISVEADAANDTEQAVSENEITVTESVSSNENLLKDMADIEPETLDPETLTPVTIANNGYAYGKAMSGSSITLVTDLTEGTGEKFQWYSAAGKEGPWTEIEGAATAEYTFTPVNGTWYKCVVNEVYETIPVQAIKAGSDSVEFLGPYVSDYWYLSNGAMAYTANGNLFDVVGKYLSAKNVKTYWMNTSYSSNWQMYSSSEAVPAAIGYNNASRVSLDALRISFSESNDRAVILEADLAEGQQSFSFGADVMLGDSTITSYADTASLKAVKNEAGTLGQIQMVGAKSVDDAVEEDPAFVLKVIDPISLFWLGRYSTRMAYAYNTSSTGQNYIYDTYGSNSVVAEVCDVDSGMTASWTNVPSGGSVKFQFSVGSVSQAGAVIKANTKVSSTSITITDVDRDYYYALYDEDGNKVAGWISGEEADENNEIIFNNLKTDTKYIIKIIKKDDYTEGDDSQNADNADDTETSTAVDPMHPGSGDGGDDEEVTPVITATLNTITISHVNVNYTYRLQKEDGTPVSEYITPVEGTVEFTGLESGTKYYLVAKSGSNQVSDRVEIETKSCESAGGHAYGEPVFAWAEDYSCVATFTCSNNSQHKENINCSVTNEILEAATVFEKGKIKYTATVEKNGNTYTSSRVADIPTLELSDLEPNDEESWKQTLEDAKNKLDDDDGSLSEEEKDELENIVEQAKKALEEIEEAKEKAEDTNKELDKIPDIKNVTSEDKDEIENTLEEIDELLEEYGDKLPEEERKALEEKKRELEKKKQKIDEVTEEIKNIEKDTSELPVEEEKTENGQEKIRDLVDRIDDLLSGNNLTAEERKELEQEKKKLEEKLSYVIVSVEQSEIGTMGGSIATELRVDKALTEASVANLTTDAAKQFLTQEEVNQVENGAKVLVFLEVKDAEETAPVTDKTLIESALENNLNNASIGMYLDLSLYKKIIGQKKSRLTSTNGNMLTVTVKIPDELKNTDGTKLRAYYVVRVHDGVPEILETFCDEANGTVSFETDRFSTYALAYKDAGKDVDSITLTGYKKGSKSDDTEAIQESTVNNQQTSNLRKKDEVPKTGETDQMVFWFIMLLTAGLGMLYYDKKNVIVGKSDGKN